MVFPSCTAKGSYINPAKENVHSRLLQEALLHLSVYPTSHVNSILHRNWELGPHPIPEVVGLLLLAGKGTKGMYIVHNL